MSKKTIPKAEFNRRMYARARIVKTVACTTCKAAINRSCKGDDGKQLLVVHRARLLAFQGVKSTIYAGVASCTSPASNT